MKYAILLAAGSILLWTGCSKKQDYDGSGNFEADEVIVSAQQNGELLAFPVEEGQLLHAGDTIGQIDITLPKLQKEQAEASMAALRQKTSDPQEQVLVLRKQLIVQEAQLAQQQREKQRTENLVKADAATKKQLDDINAAIDQLQKTLSVTRQQIQLSSTNTATQNRSILSEAGPLSVSARQFQEQINRGRIVNPVTGTVLTKYALKGELTAVGKPLYKIANTDTLTLRAYVTGDQLPAIKTGQQVKVRIDDGNKSYKYYDGSISWISGKSEFTPKTIQTKNERANLVYAVKIRVCNDGFLKIGMYGEMQLATK